MLSEEWRGRHHELCNALVLQQVAIEYCNLAMQALAFSANAAIKADGKIVVEEYWASKDKQVLHFHHAAARRSGRGCCACGTLMADVPNRNQPAYWDARFAEDGFAYGIEANDFLVSVVGQLPVGDALCLCEGEGRNATYLAQRGFQVTAMDFSQVALRKAAMLAAQRNVVLHTQRVDLADFNPGVARWDLVTMIFGQPESGIRQALYARIATCLRPGGAFVLETKAEEGATAESRYPGSALLCAEVTGLDFAIARDGVRVLKEGRYHDGEQRTAQILAFRR